MDDVETVLRWGDAPVVRVGDTVRRRTGPWTPAVHALLEHLAAVGFDGSPRLLGIDDEGREVLSYVDGVDGRQDRSYDDRTLSAEARLLRRYHDAVADFHVPASATWRPGSWQYDGPFSAATVICHNDLAPYNVLYSSSRPHTIIDWDMAGPAPVEWDVAYAAWRFVPLYPPDICARLGFPAEPLGPRLRVFCDAYGLTERADLLETLRARLAGETSDFSKRSAAVLDDNFDSWQACIT